MGYGIAFVLGCVFGSFFHVMFSRKDWYKGRSRCDHCGYTLKWYDLVPVISFLLLGGKCRKCKEKIGLTHLLSELLVGGTFACAVYCFKKFGVHEGGILSLGLFFLALASVEDLIEKQIYTVLLYTAIAACTVMRFCYVWYNENLELAMVFFVTLVLVKLFMVVVAGICGNKLGNGDLDIVLVMYIICGGYGCLYSIFCASFIGCFLYLPLILLKKFDRKTAIPFVPLLHLGTVCNIMFGVMNL